MKFLAPKCLVLFVSLVYASHSKVSAAFASSSALLDDNFKPADSWNPAASGQPAGPVSVSVAGGPPTSSGSGEQGQIL